MVENVQEFIDRRGGVGVLILLSKNPMRFNELEDELTISTGTLDKRLDEARDLGLSTTKWQQGKKPHKYQNWITERGEFLVRKMEEKGLVHHYLRMIDAQSQVKDGKAELQSWLGDEEVQKTLARCAEDDPYVDEFGQDITGYHTDKPEYDYDELSNRGESDTDRDVD